MSDLVNDRFADGYAAGRKDFQTVSGKRIEALEAALEAMCINMKGDGHAYRDCYIRARAVLASGLPKTILDEPSSPPEQE